ncbi:MAG: PepSY domain-containing protein, partial [Bacillota bacterium]|nr:PepSY domain-containing protein [Bacillota bacterium]
EWTDEDIKMAERLAQAVKDETPDVFDRVLAKIDAIEAQAADAPAVTSAQTAARPAVQPTAPTAAQPVVLKKQPKPQTQPQQNPRQKSQQKHPKQRHLLPRLVGLVASLVLVIAGSFHFYQNIAVASVVALDVNPSIEIRINRGHRVLEVSALNPDGQKVIGEMELKGTAVEVAVNAVLGSMLRLGYDPETILLTVIDNDQVNRQQLETKLSQVTEVGDSGLILQGFAGKGDSSNTLAEKLGVSPAKAHFIDAISREYPQVSVEELAQLNITQLTYIIQENQIQLEETDIVQAPKPRRDDDIDDVDDLLDPDDRDDRDDDDRHNQGNSGPETSTGSHASTVPSSNLPSGGELTREQALAIALADAGSPASYHDLKIERDYENGFLVYDIQFDANGYEYDYDIDVSTGAIRKKQVERDDDVHTPLPTNAQQPVTQPTPAPTQTPAPTTQPSPNAPSQGAEISRDQALAIALADAGNPASYYDLKIERDTEDGFQVYEVHFDVAGVEYEYDIDLYTGAIRKKSVDRD